MMEIYDYQHAFYADSQATEIMLRFWELSSKFVQMQKCFSEM